MGNVQIYQLSQQFYDDYPEQLFPEIERKSERPYTILVVEITSELKIGIPFRSHISHRNAYHFRMSKRSSNSKSGLDFSKIVILSSSDYIGNAAQIDRDEFTEYKKILLQFRRNQKSMC
ncbi:MAG: type III toxin-antitoxin system TenpIN family toxin [Culicoidibacterales bacterium]